MNIHETGLHSKGRISFGHKAKANLTRDFHPSFYIHFTPTQFPPVERVNYIFGVLSLAGRKYIT